jgi:hypothetical protein
MFPRNLKNIYSILLVEVVELVELVEDVVVVSDVVVVVCDVVVVSDVVVVVCDVVVVAATKNNFLFVGIDENQSELLSGTQDQFNLYYTTVEHFQTDKGGMPGPTKPLLFPSYVPEEYHSLCISKLMKESIEYCSILVLHFNINFMFI